MINLFLFLSITSLVAGHGFLSFPAARQYKCFRDNHFWWPETGDDIPDEACRDAYRFVYSKYRNLGESSGAAANAAQYMFQQYYEYAALAGPMYDDLEYVKENIVTQNLCAAGAVDRTMVFGDKSGIDIPLQTWRADTIYVNPDANNDNVLDDLHNITLNFCPTAVHEPSYFQVFISSPDYDYSHALSWDDLILLSQWQNSTLIENDGVDDDLCANNVIYKIFIRVPFRDNKFVLFVRWQRNDIAGEGFYNCADVVFSDTHRNYVWQRKANIDYKIADVDHDEL